MTERPLVMEWRVTYELYGYTVRFWIESDPEHGGCGQEKRCGCAGEAVQETRMRFSGSKPEPLARIMLELVTCANSVEVCDPHGDGVALHRNWP